MAKTQEKFKTAIGGQALIEGIMMRGPEKDAIVVRKSDGLDIQITARKVYPKGSVRTWPLIRGAVNFFDSQVVGVKALMHSADLAPEESDSAAQKSKFDQWLEKKLGDDRFQKYLIGMAVFLGLAMSVALFFILPMLVSSVLGRWITGNLLLHLVEGLVRILIFVGYMFLVSMMEEMKRVFSYHGAEHKTIRCYEAGLPLTVENVRNQTRLHPRCGTSFLFVVMILSILVFSVASTAFLAVVPVLAAMRGSLIYSFIMIVYKLLLLPVIVSVAYEINRFVGRHDNWFTRIMTAPGMWFQLFTTNEPDDGMIEVGIAALQAVLPEEEGADRW